MFSFVIGMVVAIVLMVAIFVFLKFKKLDKKFESEIEGVRSSSMEARNKIETKVTDTIKAFSKPNDPLINDLANAFKKKSSILADVFVKLLESSQILLGISTGLLGMSLVAVIFHFIRNVIKLDTSQLLESVAYSVFFIAVSIGIISNRYLQRKIKREQDQRLEAEKSFQEQVEQLKQEYEKLLEKNEKEKNSIVSDKNSLIGKLNEMADNRQEIIKRLEKQKKEKRFSFKKLPSLKRKK